MCKGERQSTKCAAMATVFDNQRVRVNRMYLPLVMTALSGWSHHRLYLALDTTVLWNRYCMKHKSSSVVVVRCHCCGES